MWDIHRAGTTDIVVIRLMKGKEGEDNSPSNEGHTAVTYWTLLKFKASFHPSLIVLNHLVY